MDEFIQKIQNSLDEKLKAAKIFTDLSKAFDLVDTQHV